MNSQNQNDPNCTAGGAVDPCQSGAVAPPRSRRARAPKWFSKAVCFLPALVLSLAVNSARAAEPTLSEYQVKALFIVNFTKYVEWPSNAFAEAGSPFVIGVIGENNFGPHLQKGVEGKSVVGRAILLRQVEKPEELVKCHILFVSGSEKKRLGEILDQVKEAPVLTVGESDQFAQRGGVLGFVKKEGKVRLAVDLGSARKAGLQISSKLLNVADSVTGKP